MRVLARMTIGALLLGVVVGFAWHRQTNKSEDLEGLRKEELYRRAQKAGIEGRSQMNKAELRAALTNAS